MLRLACSLLLLVLSLNKVSTLSLHYYNSQHFYDELLISISPDVPETDRDDTINNIKKWIIEGSKSLYSASQGWAHFNNVYILVPVSWSPVPGAQLAHEVHEDAQIRVEPTNSIYGDSPFTLQTGECGEEGEYIQITRNYLNQHVNITDSVFGPSGQVFLYEWSKFRYGVFEEHGYPGDPLYPMFYSKQIFTANGASNVVKPNFCTNVEPSGGMESINGGSCTINTDGMPADDCIFVVDGPSSLKSSVMSVPYLAGNDQWCDLTEERIHHSDIPTKHNTMCDGQSVFEVVRQNPDFLGYQPDINEETDTTPNFTILQPQSLSDSFVFVLDFSGSMFEATQRAAKMKKGIERFMMLDVDLQKNLSFGVTVFSSEAQTHIRQPIIPISDISSRDKIIKVVNDEPKGGGTCLQEGILKGLEALRNSGKPTGGASIFLTDGQQSCDPIKDWLSAVSSQVQAQDVRHCTIAFSDNADPDLEELALRTNGAAFFVPDNSGPEYINNAIASCLDFLPSVPSKEKDSILFQQTYEGVAAVSETIPIDHYCGKDVKIQIDYNVQVSCTVTITSSVGSQNRTFSGENSLEISFPSIPSNSDISINIESTTTRATINFLTILVKSKVQENVEPISTDCWTNAGQTDVNLVGNNPDKLVIYAKAMQGPNPIIDANVTAIITSTNKANIILNDDGLPPDNIKNDGIYSSYYNVPNVNGDVRYSLSCKIGGNDQTVVVNNTVTQKELKISRGRSLPSHPSATIPFCCGSIGVKDDVPMSPTGIFARSKSGGVITVKGNGAGDVYPPAPIRDLVIKTVVYNENFSLSFTSPGADLNIGKISQYIIFYSTNRTLLDNLIPSSNVSKVTEEMLSCNCTLDPLPALQKVDLNISSSFFDVMTEYNFRILAVDNGDKTSTSNVVVFAPSPEPNNIFDDLGLTWGIAIAIVIGSMGGTFMIAGAVIWHKWYYEW